MTGPRGLPPIETATVATTRIPMHVAGVGGRERGQPVVLLHGAVASSRFFHPLLRHLPRRLRPLAPDLRGFGDTTAAPVDATRGVRDFADDVCALLDALDLPAAHVVGWSLGGAVAERMAIDAPHRVRTLTLIAPISPYGFGGTVDAGGTLLAPDGAGSGAGLPAAAFVRALAAKDASAAPGTARALLRGVYTAPDWDRTDEDDYVRAMLSTAVGDDNYPGDSRSSAHWPGTAPGDRGVMNAVSPTHLDLSSIVRIADKPPVLWIRGSADRVVADGSSLDVAVRGAHGRVPGYPGAALAPPQPMVTQTRAVLDSYAANGGRYREAVIPGAGHCPHIEDLPRVLEALVPHLDGAQRED